MMKKSYKKPAPKSMQPSSALKRKIPKPSKMPKLTTKVKVKSSISPNMAIDPHGKRRKVVRRRK